MQVDNVGFGGLQNADANSLNCHLSITFSHLHFRVRHRLSVCLNTKP